MFTKVSVLVPTRQQIGRLQTLLASYEHSSHGAREASELVFRVDEDDEHSGRFLAGPWADAPGYRVVVGPHLGGYASMPAFFNELAEEAEGDVLLCGNDDMVFKTRHWAPLILDAANRYPDGVFDLGVATHNEDHFPFSIVSRKAVEAMGFLWDPDIFWGDIFLRDAMAAFGRCVMLPGVQIEHAWEGHDEHHPCFAFRGPEYWDVVHRIAVERAIERLRPLLG